MSESEEIVEERTYVVPLAKLIRGSRGLHRTKKAVRRLREFIARHMHVSEENVKISKEVNEKVWERGIKNPPRRVKVKVLLTEDNVARVELAE
mgnify:CR=1 FL=1